MDKRIPLSVPHMGGKEMGYVQEAFDSNWLSTVGPNLLALEREVETAIGVPAVAVKSGTAAIHLGLRALGVEPGDEVVAPTLTFVAAANPILYLGASPIFIDCEERSWNLDPSLLNELLKKRAKVSRLPKAVVAVDLYGQCADMEAINEVCRQYEVKVLEDAADAMGAHYKGRPAGVLGDVGVYSLNGNKIITCSGGGILLSSNVEWVERARYWSTQARDADPVNNYVHSELGYNYRLSNVLAGIARGQLEVLEERVQQRRAVFDRYVDAFRDVPGIAPQQEMEWGRHTRWLSCFVIDEAKFGVSRDDLIRALNAANIEARPVWKPMHTQKLFDGCECVGGEIAEDLNRRGICLPSSSSLTEEEQSLVIGALKRAGGNGSD